MTRTCPGHVPQALSEGRREGPPLRITQLQRRWARRRASRGDAGEGVPTFLPLDESDDGGEGEGGGGGGEGEGEGGARERVRTLNAATRERPGDVAAWLALAELEEGGGGALEGGGGGGGGRRAGAVAERKVSVLRRAVAANPRNEAVAVELLRAQESLLEPEEVGSAWEEAIRGDPCSVMLRMESLAHASRHVASFSVSALREAAAAAAAALRGRAEEAAAGGESSSSKNSSCQEQLFVLSPGGRGRRAALRRGRSPARGAATAAASCVRGARRRLLGARYCAAAGGAGR